MHEAFAPERQILATKLTAEEVLNQLAILESRLTKTDVTYSTLLMILTWIRA
jgi:hypothetical protein